MPPPNEFIHFVVPGDPIPSPRPRARVQAFKTFDIIRSRAKVARSMKDLTKLFTPQIYIPRDDPAELWKERAANVLRKALREQYGSSKFHPIVAEGQPIEVHLLCVFVLATSHHRKTEASRPARAWATAKRKGDFDNLSKPVCDATNEIAWHDDSQVARAFVEKLTGAQGEPPRLEFIIRPLTESPVLTHFESTLMRLKAGQGSVDPNVEPIEGDERDRPGEAQRMLL